MDTLGAVIGGLSCLVAVAVNKAVPDPYLVSTIFILSVVIDANFAMQDEVFHIPQAQRYCENDYTWDPKITTPPGLYYLSKALLRYLKCSTISLRGVNVFGVCVALPLVLRLFPDSSPSSSVTHPRGRLSARTVVMLQLFPTFYFFGFLYYTDVWSTIFALLSVALANSSSTALPVIFVKTAVGLCNLCLRQTNIVWVLYAFLTELLALLVYPDEKGKERADDAVAPNRTVYAIGSAFDVIDVCLTVVRRAVARLMRSDVKRRRFWRIVGGYGVVGTVFAAFVLYNGGITLGKSHV